ncbi:MAG: hypothetical protein R6W77_06605 [Trueperaceae bacterium]
MSDVVGSSLTRAQRQVDAVLVAMRKLGMGKLFEARSSRRPGLSSHQLAR